MTEKNEVDAGDELDRMTTAIYVADGQLLGAIAKQGGALAKKMGYGSLDGLPAIHRYLIEKHHWLPHQVAALKTDDLIMLLEGDLNLKG